MDKQPEYLDKEAMDASERCNDLYLTYRRFPDKSTDLPISPENDVERRVVSLARMASNRDKAYGQEHVALLIEHLAGISAYENWMPRDPVDERITTELRDKICEAWDTVVSRLDREPSILVSAIGHTKYCNPEYSLHRLNDLVAMESKKNQHSPLGPSYSRMAFGHVANAFPKERLLPIGNTILNTSADAMRAWIDKFGFESSTLHRGYSVDSLAVFAYRIGNLAIAQEMAEIAMLEFDRDKDEKLPQFTAMKRYIGIAVSALMAFERGDVDACIDYLAMIKTLCVPPQFHDRMETVCELAAVLTQEGHGDRVEAALAGSEHAFKRTERSRNTVVPVDENGKYRFTLPR